jgi:hypothetical protein
VQPETCRTSSALPSGIDPTTITISAPAGAIHAWQTPRGETRMSACIVRTMTMPTAVTGGQ